MHYFVISFLEYHSDEILSADYSQIPSIISQLTLKGPEMIDKVFENAKKIRAVTPYSFRLFLNQLDIFKPFSKRHKELFEHYQPENLLCLPILPSEIFYIAYNKIVSCPDKNCRFFNNLYDFENNNCIFTDKSNDLNTNADSSSIGYLNGNVNTNNSENDFFNEDKKHDKDQIFSEDNINQSRKLTFMNNGNNLVYFW